MLPRDAAASLPDQSFAHRVAVVFGITTAVVIGGAIAVVLCSSPRSHPPLEIDLQMPASIALTRPRAEPTPAEESLVATELRAYAFVTFPKWVAANPDRACPRHLLELNYYDAALHAVDPWGTPYQLICGADYGPLSVRSAGADRAFETADDLSSNTP